VGSPLSPSHRIRRVPVDVFEANESHPVGLSQTLSSALKTGDNNNMTNGIGVRGSTLLSMTPQSDAIPASASGRGVYRNLSIDLPRRPIPRSLGGSNGAALSRAHSFRVGSPSFPDRSFTNFSASRSVSSLTRDLSGYEELAWLDMNLGPGSANRLGLRRKASLAASSDVLPRDVGSIRSISPELGYIPTGESVEGHNPVGEDLLKGEKRSIAANIDAQDNGRTSRLSIGEAGILWGRLMSVMEAEEQPPSDEAPK